MKTLKVKNIFLFLVFMGVSLGLGAQEGILNKLLAPGPLSSVHQDLEKSDCLKCHETGKGIPDSKCLDCHKAIKVFVTAKKGFHGLTTQSCRECHSEHKGADFNSIAIEEKNFDHKTLTGYPLDGKHAKIKCLDCHQEKMKAPSAMAGHTRYLGKQASCLSCHKKDDPHHFKGQWAQKDCVSCHGLSSWKTGITFDHKKDAHYPLEGKHGELKCADCHGPSKNQKNVATQVIYQWPKLKTSACLTCHVDQHRSNLSAAFSKGECQTCHQDLKSWKIEHFDHKVTKYPLKEKHAELKCVDCHKQKDPKLLIENKNFKFTGLRQDCLSCHKDYHHFGPLKLKDLGATSQCQSCHTESRWQTTHSFKHETQTRYPIDGAHSKLECNECHVEQSKQKTFIKATYKWPALLTKTCENCHRSPHQNQFSAELLKKRCTDCHTTMNWYQMKSGQGFDHKKTRFPLTGAHQEVRCNDCHNKSDEKGKQVYKFKSYSTKFCNDCHSNIHQEQFSAKLPSQDCSSCHTTVSFKDKITFDHKTTRYPLEGAHTKVDCSSCHLPGSKQITLSSPNIHRSKTQESKPLVLSQFLFPKVTRTECLSCHKDYHKGQLSSSCLNCHSLEKWTPAKFEHNKQSDYVLRGKHLETKCQDCHKAIKEEFTEYKKQNRPLIRYKPISGQCLTCHKDVHAGNFGNSCQECHLEKGWKVTKDFHKNFTLTGVHYSLECSECHKESRKLSGLSQSCVTCHAKDDVHNGTLPECRDCHRQQFWEVSGFKHSLTKFPLRGAHRTLNCVDCHLSGTYKGLSNQCSSCHLSDAIAATSHTHTGTELGTNCNSCHLNQFSWR